MHIRFTFSSSYYKYIYSIDIPNMVTYLDRAFKEEKNDIILIYYYNFNKLL